MILQHGAIHVGAIELRETALQMLDEVVDLHVREPSRRLREIGRLPWQRVRGQANPLPAQDNCDARDKQRHKQQRPRVPALSGRFLRIRRRQRF
jgi:hypothetical protein